ncbi:hypothetical protein [Pseudomonas putida]|uniref:hypothetical protein n=1 Tax=Pseudomonas putida TaxID=303 RepID=UPI003D959DDF
MEILNIIDSISSILSLLVSLFVAAKVVKIGNDISVKGDNNMTIGGNAKIK